jgi:hypothetical protein
MDEAARAEQSQAKQNGPGSVQGRVLEAATYRAGSIVEIAERLELPTEDVAKALRVLDREGEVRSRVEGNSLVWGAA